VVYWPYGGAGMKGLTSTLDLVRADKPAVKANRGMLVEIRAHSVPWSSVVRLSLKLGVATAQLLPVIGMAERTGLRRQKEGYLKPDEADRLLRVGRVFEEATRVLGSQEKAAQWLGARSVVLSEATPLSLLDSDAGTQAVTEELTRIDFGDFA
jgi:putative toxin-antitoxin system antitoxin component (TIGR02293 family)